MLFVVCSVYERYVCVSLISWCDGLVLITLIIGLEPVIGRDALSVDTLKATASVVRRYLLLLDSHVFISIDFVIGLVEDRDALTRGARRNTSDLRCFNDTYVVEDSSDAVVVCVGNVDFDITPLLIVQRRYATWFVEASLKCGIIHQFVLSIAQPREDLVSERIHNLDLVVVGVSYDDHILLRNEVHSERMLQFGFYANTINITVSMQVTRVRISTDQVS